MTYEIDWKPAAVDLAARYLMDDPEGLSAVLAPWTPSPRIPDPTVPFPSGQPGCCACGLEYRVVYQIDEATRPVSVMHVGRRD